MDQLIGALWFTFFIIPGIPLLVLWEKVTGKQGDAVKGKTGIGILFKRATIAASVFYVLLLVAASLLCWFVR
jgi:hypothetical protein